MKRFAALAVAATVLLTGCTLDADRRLVEGVVEEWQAPPFYELPDPLPAGDPGDIVRSEPITSTMLGSKAWRVLYHSTDLDGTDILTDQIAIKSGARIGNGFAGLKGFAGLDFDLLCFLLQINGELGELPGLLLLQLHQLPLFLTFDKR